MVWIPRETGISSQQIKDGIDGNALLDVEMLDD